MIWKFFIIIQTIIHYCHQQSLIITIASLWLIIIIAIIVILIIGDWVLLVSMAIII